MYDICENVALKHGGSLKAEHGTGRNVAPFVEMEWGTKAYKLMWEVRRHRQRALPPRVPHTVAQAPRAQPRCPLSLRSSSSSTRSFSSTRAWF